MVEAFPKEEKKKKEKVFIEIRLSHHLMLRCIACI